MKRTTLGIVIVLLSILWVASAPLPALAGNSALINDLKNSILMQNLSKLFSQSSFGTSGTGSLGGSTGTGSSVGGMSGAMGTSGSAGGSGGGSSMGINQPYGGKVLMAIPCTCSSGDFLITLGPPSAGTYLYSPSSAPTMYKYGLVIVPGVNHLGFYRPFGLCWMIAYPCTSIMATRGTITSVATSLPGM